AMIEKEPITVVLSAKGWIRAVKGHDLVSADMKYKEGDREEFILEAQTTDKIIAFSSNGRFYTLAGDKLPSGRGFGDPIRLQVEIPNDADIVAMTVWEPDQRFLLGARDGKGFIISSNDVLAQTRNGKAVMSVEDNGDAILCRLIDKTHDYLAVVGTNRKMLVFKLDQIPEMAKGKGVILQKFKDGELSDAKSFKLKDGLTFLSGTRSMPIANIKEWIGERAQAGKLPPNGFPRSNRFE
ncbi:MAG: DNA gyrase C-terminal beta-propeller domain-containing protein, partial [Pseudomonadota bacterium]